MIFPDDAIGMNIFPRDLAHYLNDYYSEKGVDVFTSDSVSGPENHGTHFTVRTRTGQAFEVDGVVAGIGIRPNLEPAQQAGLHPKNGIVVDERLMASAPNIFAAVDVANFYHSALGKRVRVVHEDNAIAMGKLAGRNMAGANEPNIDTPTFYSDLFDLGYEAVGEISSNLETVTDWQEPFKRGTIYYLKNARVRGVLLWNVWNQVDKARALIAEPGPYKAADLIGRFS